VDWEQALAIVVERTKHKRYVGLCDESWPDHAYWRREMIRMAAIEPNQFPSLARQAGNFAAAMGRAGAALVTGKPVKVAPDEHDRRWGLCMTCPNLVNDKCKLCGCFFRAKIGLAQERCPIGRWERVEVTP
jgi:hypothetical protein